MPKFAQQRIQPMAACLRWVLQSAPWVIGWLRMVDCSLDFIAHERLIGRTCNKQMFGGRVQTAQHWRLPALAQARRPRIRRLLAWARSRNQRLCSSRPRLRSQRQGLPQQAGRWHWISMTVQMMAATPVRAWQQTAPPVGRLPRLIRRPRGPRGARIPRARRHEHRRALLPTRSLAGGANDGAGGCAALLGLSGGGRGAQAGRPCHSCALTAPCHPAALNGGRRIGAQWRRPAHSTAGRRAISSAAGQGGVN